MAWRVLNLALAVMLAGAASGRADMPLPPFSYRQGVPGGRFVFVMLAPGPVDAGVWGPGRAAEAAALRRAYPRSGLYRADGPAEPLWTVDWYAFAHEVEAASDGVHLVRRGPWASSVDDEAAGFFAAGRLMRTYQVQDLVGDPRGLPRSVSHFFWRESDRFDDARLEYAVATLDGGHFVFDARTGGIVTESRPAWGGFSFYAAALGTGVAGAVGCWAVRRRRGRKSVGRPPETPAGFNS